MRREKARVTMPSVETNKQGRQASAYNKANKAPVKEPPRQLEKGPLLKVLTAHRIGSRRKLASVIKAGKIKVNDIVIEDFSFPVNLKNDTILLDGKRIQPELSHRVVLLFNKPAGVVTTTSDELGRTTVMNLLPQKFQGLGLYPVGRLDKDSTGLLLITNDGAITYQLTHPKFEHEKEYFIAINEKLRKDDLEKVRKGVMLDDGPTSPAVIAEVQGQPPFNYKMIVHEGRKRQIRRTFESLGFRVTALKRVRLGTLMLGALHEGEVRELTQEEIARLTTPTAYPGKPIPARRSSRGTSIPEKR